MDDYSSKSFRLLAMAVGVIPKAAKLSLVHMTQQQVEAGAINMHLLCLLVLTNNIRSDSKATITQLQEGYVLCSPTSSKCRKGMCFIQNQTLLQLVTTMSDIMLSKGRRAQ